MLRLRRGAVDFLTIRSCYYAVMLLIQFFPIAFSGEPLVRG